ncbi:MAG: hypothetical protein GX484_05295 [Chloroflexi bacterium]|nr:hypothetical protein [Chloroflexota bacterium]
MPTLSDIRLDWIQDDPATQPRAALDDATVDRYAEALERGERLPPVVVFHEDDKSSAYWLADGWHRRAAALKLERKFLPAEVHLGTKRDAMLYAAGANAAHGLPRSNEDKRRAVLMLLTDDEWRQWSDHEIARRTLTSQPFVSKLRRELSDNGYQMPEERLFQRGGETYTQNVNTEARVEAARARVEAELQARILDLLQKPLTTAQIRELLDIGLDDKAGLEALRRALETLVSEQRVRRLRDLYLPAGPTKAKPVADEEAVNLLRRVVAQHQRDFPTLSSIKIAWLRSHTLMNEDVLNAAIDALCEAGELERDPLLPLVVRIKKPVGRKVPVGERLLDVLDPDEREEIPEGSEEWQQSMAEDDARRAQTEAEAEATPDDELADDCTGDYEDEPDEHEADAEDWEKSLPPTQTALDADRLLKLIPEGQAVSFEFLQEQTGLPKDRVVRAVNLLAADLKVKTAQRQVMRLAQDAIPAELRVAVLHLLHELRANSESLLAAAWDGADYTDTSDAAKLAIREGWISPVSKWASGSKWCAGYVLTDAGRDVYAKLRAEHPDEVDDTLPPAVQRLYQRTVVELDRLINSASRATRVTQASMYLAGKLSDADAEALAQRIDLAQVRVRGALNSLTGLLIVLQPDDPDEV